MGRNLSKEELAKHKNNAVEKLDTYLSSLCEHTESKIRGKADKLSFWLEDWSTFLEFESDFAPTSLRRYKRGEIIKAHLGYNVGSEEGGLHYCVVIDKNNSRNSPVITIIPLTSVKKKTNLEHLHKGCIYLGNELFTNLSSKISYTEKTPMSRIDELEEKLSLLNANTSNEKIAAMHSQLNICEREMKLLKDMKSEILKMKLGSIALTNQIRTISKIRIYDPKTNWDILSGVKLSNEKLDLLDAEIINNFTNGINPKN